ncbi:trypsin-like serine peptidase, partial [Crossiella equi]
TPAERAAALAYWTPERMRETGSRSEDRAERVATKWDKPVPAGVGRLFIRQESKREQPFDTWCTATAVRSANRDTLVTAAHCVWPGTDRWEQPILATNLVFVPGYEAGKPPRAAFAARASLLAKSYTTSSEPDVAMVVLDPADGKHVNGTRRLDFGRQGDTPAQVFGYPGSKAGLGQSLFRCDLTATPTSIGRWQLPCDMAGGSSGGPWFAGGENGPVFSVTSRGTVELDEETGEIYTKDLEGASLRAAKPLYERAASL